MKKKIKNIILILLVCTLTVSCFTSCSDAKNKETGGEIIVDKKIETFRHQDYMIIDNNINPASYNGEYSLEYFEGNGIDQFKYSFNKVLKYEDYENLCKELGIKQKYNDINKEYAVIAYASQYILSIDAKLIDIEYDGDTLIAYVRDNAEPLYKKDKTIGYIIAIPLEAKVSYLDVVPVLTKKEFEELKENQEFVVDKPIIYLYPTSEKVVSVKLPYFQNITCSYPKYNDGWTVLARPDGTLKDIKTNRELYALYYESIPSIKPQMTDEGFVVSGEDTIAFLEEKLSILGLTEKEAEEFIVYWLPILENNKYNYIRFATKDEIDQMIPLEVTPTPDTVIRVIMLFKELDEKIEINEQELVQQNREGFTVVEWGGCELQ